MVREDLGICLRFPDIFNVSCYFLPLERYINVHNITNIACVKPSSEFINRIVYVALF